MDSNQAKWFLQIFAAGKKLNPLTIQQLYLAGYVAIDLHSPANQPVPTVITEKGLRLLQGDGCQSGRLSGFAMKCIFAA